MKLLSLFKNITTKDKSFSCQRQSFSERNFQGALPLEKETYI